MSKLKKTSFLEGAYIATACIFISKLLGILYVIPFYRIIGKQGGALYGYAYNIYNVFLTISSVGIPFAISKLTSEYTALGEKNKKIRMYRLASYAVAAFSLLSFLVCFIFSEPIAKLIIGDISGGNSMEDVVFVIRCISFTLLIVPMLSIKRGYLQGHKYISQPSLSQIVEQIVRISVLLIGSYIFVYFVKSVRNAVGISVLAAGIGGLAAYIYLSFVVRSNKNELGLSVGIAGTRSEDKKIIKDIIVCALPFIIINLANTLYTSTDMVLVLRTLPKLGFNAEETEFISSVFTTWGTKFNAIITSVSTGLIVSLIPHIVSDYTSGRSADVNTNFNKCLKMIMLIIAPLSCFISLMSDSFWTIFYGYDKTGPYVIRFTIIVTVFDCLYMVLNSLMQSLNRKQIIYFSVISGLVTNLVLDIPMMHLFNAFGLPAYIGAVFATFTGFTVSNVMSLTYLRRHIPDLRYTDTLKALPRALTAIAAALAVGIAIRYILPTESHSKLVQLFNILACGIPCGMVYIAISLKQLKSVLPPKLLRLLHLK